MTFLSEAAPWAEAQAKYDDDQTANGFVMSLSHVRASA
jgi:hypothetical protein